MVEVIRKGGKKGSMVRFSFAAAPGRTVALAGVFNDWDPGAVAMRYCPEKSAYCCELELPPGSYDYKFVINGEWVLDESNPNFASNDFGTLNSVVVVE